MTAMWGMASAAAADADGSVVSDPVAVEAKYGSSPKGVTVEGMAQGFPQLVQVDYDKARNQFNLNGGTAQYVAPVAAADLEAIFRAIARDDRMGVTLKQNKSFFMYGALSERARISQDLATADRILGGTVFATREYLQGVRLPKDFVPTPVNRRRQIWSAARFNYTNYVFAPQPGTTLYRRAGYQLVPTLTPVIPGAARDGGHAVDRARIQAGIFGEPEDVQNFNFLLANIQEFLQIPALARAGQIGEAAAFARLLKANRVNLDELANRMR